MSWKRGWVAGFLFLACFSLSCAPLDLSFPSFSRSGVAQRPRASRVRHKAPRPDQSVRQVQGLLHEHGYDAGPLDGLIGRQTRRALREFQRDHNLPETGQIDVATKAALLQTPAGPS